MSNDDNTTTEAPVTGGNVFRVLQGGKEDISPAADSDEIPQNEYLIVDINGNEHFFDGFLLFTSQHIAIMRDTGAGALPVFVMPLNMVFSAELVEDDEIFDEVDEVL